MSECVRDLVSEGVLVVSEQEPGHVALAGLDLGSDPAELLLHLHQGEALLQRNAADNKDIITLK